MLAPDAESRREGMTDLHFGADLLPTAHQVAWVMSLVALLFAGLWWRARTRGSRRSRSRNRRAQIGEGAAERLLERAGFAILERQLHTTWSMMVDGTAREVRSRADLLVQARRVRGIRRGAVFVAEVKTGTTAPDPTHPATRRQLLEYLHVFDAHGVLLVDMEAQRVHRVAFPG